jgi:hypothetical protein
MITPDDAEAFVKKLNETYPQWTWTIYERYDAQAFQKSVLSIKRAHEFEVRIESPLDSEEWTFLIYGFRGQDSILKAYKNKTVFLKKLGEALLSIEDKWNTFVADAYAYNHRKEIWREECQSLVTELGLISPYEQYGDYYIGTENHRFTIRNTERGPEYSVNLSDIPRDLFCKVATFLTSISNIDTIES